MQCSAGSPAGPVHSNNTPCNHRAITEPTNRARSATSSGSTRGFSVIYKSNHLFVIQLEGHHRRQSARISKVVSRRCFQNTHSYSRRPCASPTSDKQEAQCPGTIRPLKRVLSPSTSNRQISRWRDRVVVGGHFGVLRIRWKVECRRRRPGRWDTISRKCYREFFGILLPRVIKKANNKSPG